MNTFDTVLKPDSMLGALAFCLIDNRAQFFKWMVSGCRDPEIVLAELCWQGILPFVPGADLAVAMAQIAGVEPRKVGVPLARVALTRWIRTSWYLPSLLHGCSVLGSLSSAQRAAFISDSEEVDDQVRVARMELGDNMFLAIVGGALLSTFVEATALLVQAGSLGDPVSAYVSKLSHAQPAGRDAYSQAALAIAAENESFELIPYYAAIALIPEPPVGILLGGLGSKEDPASAGPHPGSIPMGPASIVALVEQLWAADVPSVADYRALLASIS